MTDTKLAAAVIAALWLAGPAVAAGIPRGARLAAACAACHGPEGRSRGAIPTLAGMPQQRFIARMQAFKQQPDSIMGRVVPAYDTADIQALAHYFAQRPPADAAQP